MALFTDGLMASIADLTLQDSSLIAIAGSEGIDVTNKLNAAQDHISADLAAIFQGQQTIYSPLYGQTPLDTIHLAVTPALKLWHVYQSLAMFYSDVYFNEINDRYLAKRNQFQSLATWAKKKFVDAGIGLVTDPLSMASQPGFTFQPASQPGGTFYICVTYVNVAGEESTPSIVTSVSVPDGNVLLIGAVNMPPNSSVWNVYVGTNPTGLSLQNSTPIAAGQNWQYTAITAVTGRAPGTGQIPNSTRLLPTRIQRG